MARIGVVWAKGKVTRKILKTVAIGSITFYLTKKYKYLEEKHERRNEN